jgi:hypothetical protein
MSNKRTKAKSARKTSGKVKTATAAQKPAVGQRGAKAEASSNDHPTVDMLWEEVARVYTGPRVSPDPAHADDEEAKAAEMGRPESVEESEHRRAIFKRRRADEPKAIGKPAANMITRQIQEDIEGLLSLAIRLRTAAEARAHNPVSPDYEDPNVFAAAVAPLIPQLARATHLLVEFLNIDCDQGGLARGEVEAAMSKSLSWPDLYFHHSGAQAYQLAKYKPKKSPTPIGSDLPFYIKHGKEQGSEYVRAAVNTLRFVYSNLVRFALQPPGIENDENPLRTWVRENKLTELCKFVATMRYAPKQDRTKAIDEMIEDCPGWELPQWLNPLAKNEAAREFAGRNWGGRVCYKIMERIEEYSGVINRKRIDFTEWAPELKAIFEWDIELKEVSN